MNAASLAHVKLKVDFYNKLAKSPPPTNKANKGNSATPLPGMQHQQEDMVIVQDCPPIKAPCDYTAVFGRLNLGGHDHSPQLQPIPDVPSMEEDEHAVSSSSTASSEVEASSQEDSEAFYDACAMEVVDPPRHEGEQVVKEEDSAYPAAQEAVQVKGNTTTTTAAALLPPVPISTSKVQSARESEEVLCDFRQLRITTMPEAIPPPPPATMPPSADTVPPSAAAADAKVGR